MNCAYHPINLANARCSSCARALCPACDHRIKGHPCCQDCIVAGVDMLRRSAPAGRRPSAPPPDHQDKQDKWPGLATLLALVPGLGAAYNGQIIKALVHFAATVGLWQVADLFHSVLFGLGGLAFYLYSIYDAKRSAQRLRAGEDLSAEDARLRRLLQDYPHIWGGVLVSVGVLSILNVFFAGQLRHFWPLLLVAAGVYLLRDYRRRRPPAPARTHYPTPPPSVIATPFDRSAAEYARVDLGRYDQ